MSDIKDENLKNIGVVSSDNFTLAIEGLKKMKNDTCIHIRTPIGELYVPYLEDVYGEEFVKNNYTIINKIGIKK